MATARPSTTSRIAATAGSHTAAKFSRATCCRSERNTSEIGHESGVVPECLNRLPSVDGEWRRAGRDFPHQPGRQRKLKRRTGGNAPRAGKSISGHGGEGDFDETVLVVTGQQKHHPRHGGSAQQTASHHHENGSGHLDRSGVVAQCPCQAAGKATAAVPSLNRLSASTSRSQSALRLRFPEGGNDGNRVRGGNQSAEHQ